MQSTITIGHGTLRGSDSGGVRRFLGIPYAASPTGPRRFQAPAPVTPWYGERDATTYGPTPPKPPYPSPINEIIPETEVPGDDYLNLNVWTPAGGVAHPVFVWFHGGAFANGNSSLPGYDGTAFARDGVVFVSVNYRLGAEGFALLRDAPANRGLLDQIAALEWVRDNIEAFGGDPANVTIAGESAGAMSVTLLMVSPRAEGLFAKVVAQSGSTQAAATPRDAMMVTAELGRVLGFEVTARSLASVDTATLITAQRQVSAALTLQPDPARYGASVVAAAMAFIPVIDGSVVPVHPAAAIAAGARGQAPLLIGTNTHENRLFLTPPGLTAGLPADVVAGMCAAAGIPESVAAHYAANRPGETPGDVFAALLTDAYFRFPAFAAASAHASHGAPVYVYEFAQHAAIGDLRACHALEIGFVFDNLGTSNGLALYGPGAPQALADEMHAAWVRFARTGDAGWAAFDASCPVMVFADGATGLVRDPRGDERAAWSATGKQVAA